MEEKHMWKTSEVCKMVGITRRALQEYDKVGLLHPTETNNRINTITNKEISQLNLYDEEAVGKLFLIQIFVEADYDRKAIKKIFESPTLDLYDEFEHMLDRMEEKRKRIDGFINTLKIMKANMKAIVRFPESVIQALNPDITRMYRAKSFAAQLDDVMIQTAELGDFESEDPELIVAFGFDFLALVALRTMGVPEDAKDTQTVARLAFDDFIKMINESEDSSGETQFDEDMTEGKLVEMFLEMIQYITNEPEWIATLSENAKLYGWQSKEDTIEYIQRAVEIFCNTTSNA